MTRKKLRVGLLLDDYRVAAWSHRMIEDIVKSECAEVVLVVLNANSRKEASPSFSSRLRSKYKQMPGLLMRKGLELLYHTFIERTTYLPDAHEEVDAKPLLAGVPVVHAKVRQTRWSDRFQSDDIRKVQEHDVDILVRCGFRILRGSVLTSAKYGVWSFHHGDNQVNRGGPAGFWESMESWPTTGSTLQILTEDLDNGKVLYRSLACTDAMSVTDNRSAYFWKSLSFMTRKMRELYDVGPEDFFKRVERENAHPSFYSERLYVKPGIRELARLTFKKMLEKARLLYEEKFFMVQWILLYHLQDEFSSSLWRYKRLVPPKDRFWADPHVVYSRGRYYVFLEEFMYESQKGHIAFLTMDEDGTCDKPKKILERSYHLSYPFVFEHENTYYMIPESAANRTIELYKCVEFPHKWEFAMNLMENVRAVDATVLYHEGKWWLFTNMVEREGVSSWDELFLFSSDDLLSNEWRPHPMNPIVSDVRSSRPAGRIFIENGRLYRPSQNSSHYYGYGFNIAEITCLDDTRYSEVIVSRVRPHWDKSIVGTHTFSRTRSLHMIDALYKRRK